MFCLIERMQRIVEVSHLRKCFSVGFLAMTSGSRYFVLFKVMVTSGSVGRGQDSISARLYAAENLKMMKIV